MLLVMVVLASLSTALNGIVSAEDIEKTAAVDRSRHAYFDKELPETVISAYAKRSSSCLKPDVLSDQAVMYRKVGATD